MLFEIGRCFLWIESVQAKIARLCPKSAAMNLTRLFLLAIRSTCVNELRFSEVEVSCPVARLGT